MNTMVDERIQEAVQRDDAGYGLASVLVALILLSVGVLSVSNVLTQSVTMQTLSSQRSNALTIAQTQMEGIRAMDPLTVASVASIQVNEDGVPDANGQFSRAVVVDSAGRNLLSVTVVVTSPRAPPINLVTWIYDGAF